MNIEEYIDEKGCMFCGQRLKYITGDEYILAHVSQELACIISLTNGNRYHDAVNVGNAYEITYEMMSSITDGDDMYFEVIE